LLGLIQALLALALVIAVLGIANTLGLSVFERTRELGMLRAMGLTVKQVRLLIQVEAAAIAVLGAALGVLAGTIMGVAVQRSQTDAGITELVIPWSVLFGYILIAAVVGVFAAWLPAVRASKLEILPSLKAD
jgi:putative ABC transport system permease protein